MNAHHKDWKKSSGKIQTLFRIKIFSKVGVKKNPQSKIDHLKNKQKIAKIVCNGEILNISPLKLRRRCRHLM